MAALVIPHFWFGDSWPVDLVRITISFSKSSIRVPVAALRGRRLIVPCCQEKHFLKRKLRRWCDWWTCRRRRVLAGSLRRQNIAPAETWSITARPSKSAFFFFGFNLKTDQNPHFETFFFSTGYEADEKRRGDVDVDVNNNSNNASVWNVK